VTRKLPSGATMERGSRSRREKGFLNFMAVSSQVSSAGHRIELRLAAELHDALGEAVCVSQLRIGMDEESCAMLADSRPLAMKWWRRYRSTQVSSVANAPFSSLTMSSRHGP
jgi:hypothetical protein